MNPPIVVALTMPSAHNNSSTTATVHNISSSWRLDHASLDFPRDFPRRPASVRVAGMVST
jgi:hypothetical protein